MPSSVLVPPVLQQQILELAALRNLVLILLDPLVVLLLHRIKHVQQGQQLSVQIRMLL